jgi:hypothetical protein
MRPHLTQNLANLKDISKNLILSAEHKSDFKMIISLLEKNVTYNRQPTLFMRPVYILHTNTNQVMVCED